MLLTAITSYIFSVNKSTSAVDNVQILAQGFNVFILVKKSCFLFVICFFFLLTGNKQSLAAILHHFEYTRNPISSGVLLIYWLMEIIFGAVKLRTMLIAHRNTGKNSDHFALYLILYALTILIFVLENVPKPKKQYIFLDDEDEVEINEIGYK